MRAIYAIMPLCLVAAAAAQSVTVPSAAATTRPTISPFYIGSVFYSTTSTTTASDSHSQSIVDVNDIGMPTAVWNSLAVRRPIGLGNANNAFTANATIVLSVSPNDWSMATNTFASNHGPMPTTVLSGQISLPAATNQATWPAPWQTPFPFSTPYVFVGPAGKSLVIDIMQTGNTGTTQWYIEYTTPDRGGRNANGAAPSTCKNSGGQYASGLSYNGTIIPGSVWYVNYSGLPNNAPGFAWLGSQGVGGSWSGLPLPVDLTPYGAPGCNIFASPDYVIPMVATGTSSRWPNIQIPNSPAVAGVSFFDHSLWLDPPANAWGLVVGWSSRWAIGTQIGAPGAFLVATGNSAGNPTGTLTPGGMPTFQLN